MVSGGGKAEPDVKTPQEMKTVADLRGIKEKTVIKPDDTVKGSEAKPIASLTTFTETAITDENVQAQPLKKKTIATESTIAKDIEPIPVTEPETKEETVEPAQVKPVIPEAKEKKPLKKTAAAKKKGKGTVRELKSQASTGRYRLSIVTDQPVSDFAKMLIDRPPRLVIDVKGKWRYEKDAVFKTKSDLVERVRIGEHPEHIRLVFDLKTEQVSYAVRKASDGLLVTIGSRKPGEPEIAVPEQ